MKTTPLRLYAHVRVAPLSTGPYHQININGNPMLHARNYKHAKCNKLQMNFPHNSVVWAVDMLMRRSFEVALFALQTLFH